MYVYYVPNILKQVLSFSSELFPDDGVIAADEFRYNCVSRIPVDSIDVLDEAYQSLLTVE